IHVHHGLQAAGEGWPAHCQAICDGLDVPLQMVRVNVVPGASLERAAREARYEAFSECLGEGELLLTGQHRDDQAETVLFRLLRGAGVRGLAAMPVERSLGLGRLVRPLLGVSRIDL
ncbi:tRNA(Ile)-lysidine synthetase, partial [Klebsiella pneumoniae]|nr:tRNA(Ile)-lysidine synthetase [Klebsiella pneumoniae]